jgi:carboxymethylenebutenolidase
MASGFITLKASDGHSFSAYRAEPTGAPKGAVVVVQEIFGVNSHIRAVADGYAAAGYLAIAPAVFDRVEKNVDLGYTPDDIQKGVGIRQQLTNDGTLADIAASVAAAQEGGKVGIVGYCFGGLMSWLSSAHVPGLTAAVSYYGGGVGQNLDIKPKVPVMLHFGEKDSHIPLADVEALRQRHHEATIFIYNADHGFNCDQRGSYDKPSAEQALGRSLGFFAKYLG